VIQNWAALQSEYQSYYGIVDQHALTTGYEDGLDFGVLIREIALDWLSVGIDPDQSAVFVQSHIKEHAELHLLLSMITPLSWLERVPTYKDQMQQLGKEGGKDIATYGFLGYPLLMAADILVYKADTVPVGEDQIPHVELCREIARRFNHLYGPVFPEPAVKLSEASLVPGLDARKMSKSYGNDISMSGEPEEIRAKVRMMVTDPQRVRKTDPGHPEVCVVYAFHKLFNPDICTEIETGCKAAAMGCVACKQQLAERMIAHLAPVRERRLALEANPRLIDEILCAGAEKARQIARQTMREVKEAIKL
ncbi:MAG: tryptophan--tRNA ligase, partial [Bacillota bacterium]